MSCGSLPSASGCWIFAINGCTLHSLFFSDFFLQWNGIHPVFSNTEMTRKQQNQPDIVNFRALNIFGARVLCQPNSARSALRCFSDPTNKQHHSLFLADLVVAFQTVFSKEVFLTERALELGGTRLSLSLGRFFRF